MVIGAHEDEVVNVVALFVGHGRIVAGRARFLATDVGRLGHIGIGSRDRDIGQVLAARRIGADPAASERQHDPGRITSGHGR
ncbi:hypothetical protein D3C72_2379390 [compost metagenome]